MHLRDATLLSLWIVASLLALVFTPGCSDSTFSAEDRADSGAEPDRGEGDGQPGEQADDQGGDQGTPELDIDVGDGQVSGPVAPDAPSATPPAIDYLGCAKLAGSGKRPYGQCAAREVVVIVNDGTTPEMTCCPTQGAFLSDDPAKQFMPRMGLCGAGEVATGMIDSRSSTLYCSALADGRKLKAASPAIYATSTAGLGADVAVIMAVYHGNDTCLCPAGTVSLGGHSSSDNRCSESCAAVE
jgi:hypothetical protein